MKVANVELGKDAALPRCSKLGAGARCPHRGADVRAQCERRDVHVDLIRYRAPPTPHRYLYFC